MKAQRGFVALLMMVLVAVGVFGAMAAWVASEPPPSKQSINRVVLAQAKEALLAYVAVSGDPTKMLTDKTRLPCPDRIGNGIADTSNCRAMGEIAFGLLPWSTLGLPPLRDADGECLWYAVSGNFKDTSAAIFRPVNADTTGMIKVVDEAGRDLATELVAVVFAPGGKLASQVRTDSSTLSADKPCATPTSATPGSGAPTDITGYLDIGNALLPPLPAASVPVTFAQLTGTVDKQSRLNDQLAWITSDDYAANATQRNAEVLKDAFKKAVAASGSSGLLPFAVDTPGGTCKPPYLYSGFLPSSCSYVNAAGTTFTFTLDPVPLVPSEATHDDWPQQAFYAVAPGCAFNAPSCDTAAAPVLTLPGMPPGPPAAAALLMRGRQQPNCLSTDPSLTVLEQWSYCIESKANRDALIKKPTDATHARTFVTPDKRPTSNDVLKELK